MTTRRIAMGAVLALGLALSACGGDDDGGDGRSGDGQPMAAAAFRRAAEELCTNANTDLLEAPFPKTRDALDGAIARARANERELFRRLRTLRPPASLRKDVDAAIAAGTRYEAYDAFMRAGLNRCAAAGVTGIGGGDGFVAELEPLCREPVQALERARTLPAGRGRNAAIAAALHDLHLALDPVEPLAAARGPFEEAVAGLERIARMARDAADADDPRAAARRFTDAMTLNAFAWSLLNVETCSDLWDGLAEAEGGATGTAA